MPQLACPEVPQRVANCVYFAGLRPAEAPNLRLTDCAMLEESWGRATLNWSRPCAVTCGHSNWARTAACS